MTVYRRNPLLMTVMGANPGARRKRPVDDPIDHAIGQAWHRLMSGVQVPMLDIPRIFRDVKLEMAGGAPLEEAVLAVGQRYRVNRNGGYRRNPSFGASLAGGMAGAFVTHALSNPGPSFIVIDSTSGVVQFRRVASGTGQQAFNAAHERAQDMANKLGRMFYVFLDMHGSKVGARMNLPMIRVQGATAVYPSSLLRNPRKSSTKKISKPRRPQRPGLKPVKVIQTTTTQKTMMNPGPGRRKITMTIEQFARWVKAKRDPVMWKAFLAKFKGYEKWTHGSKSRKVTVEWQNVPGVDGLWITYDGGRQPESTYVMPRGSKRKGAWKHPWDTMPEIKHDAEAGLVLTKLRGKSRISDFYHR